ncbi:MAG: hypothetical protein IJT54_04445 [Candidatus Methanomethylophilaceae archaeon]|nr:hypothetical protein [Candidatus Methanomethylophilaceae archaeon]
MVEDPRKVFDVEHQEFGECPYCGSDAIWDDNYDMSEFDGYMWKSTSYECEDCAEVISYDRDLFLNTYEAVPYTKKKPDVKAFWGKLPVKESENTGTPGFWNDSKASSGFWKVNEPVKTQSFWNAPAPNKFWSSNKR